MTVLPFFLSLVVAAAASPLSTSSTPYHNPSTLTLAPVLNPGPDHAHRVLDDHYIVVLKPGVHPSVMANHLSFVQSTHALSGMWDDFAGGLRHVFDSRLKGYAGKFAPETVEMIRAMPEVDFIEQDQIVTAFDLKTQNKAPWGLARISHRKKLSLGNFNKYTYEPRGGDGVDVYVIDTGINIKHNEFEGRAIWGKTIPRNASDFDGNGHGTHCAGTIASRAYGVAKAANVIAVKVLDDNGSGTMSDVVAGVEWASNAASAKLKAAQQEYAKTGKTKHKGSVANMSLGGGKSKALDTVVDGAVEDGMHFAVAAGNDNRNACDYSPAAAEKAVTVGASTLGDERAYFSNYGECVDVFAPGLNILSTWNTDETATNVISGTSMASPHTAGLLAYLLSIYPSNKFDPNTEVLTHAFDAMAFIESTADLLSQSSASPSWSSSLLRFLKDILVRRAEDDETVGVAPIPPHTITPAQLKKALLNLSTKGALSDLPSKTPNLLIFNNATA